MKKFRLFATLLLLVFVLGACSGIGLPKKINTSSLPVGMSEVELFNAGKDVMLLLVNGEYEAVHAMLREDQRALVTVDDIREVVTAQLNDAGSYKQIDDHMATGQDIDGERYGISVLYCSFSKEDVLIRISFDAEMQLVGFSLKQQ